MRKIMKLFVILLTKSINLSLAALTAAIYENSYTLVDIETLSGQVKYLNNEISEVIGITNDKLSGKFYLISGFLIGKQSLIEYDCENEFVTVEKISPSILLGCLTSGPKGVYAINILSNEVGILDTYNAEWNPVSLLPPPYDAYALAQDNLGKLHYISGDGKYYTNPGSQQFFENTQLTFPTEAKGFCGDFNGGDVVSASFDKKGGTVRYNLSLQTAIQEQTTPKVLLNDLTPGAFPVNCVKIPATVKKPNTPILPSQSVPTSFLEFKVEKKAAYQMDKQQVLKKDMKYLRSNEPQPMKEEETSNPPKITYMKKYRKSSASFPNTNSSMSNFSIKYKSNIFFGD